MEVTITTKTAFGTPPLARLDAEYIRGSSLRMEAQLLRHGGKPVASLARQYDGPVLNDAHLDEEATIRYVDLDAVDQTDGFAFADDLRYGDRPSRAKYLLQAGDILVANVRPERGVLTLVDDRLAGSVASSGFTLLRKGETNSGWEFAYAFLRSKYGREQLIRRSRGSMYPAVLGRDVFDVVIPAAPAFVAGTAKHAVNRVLDSHRTFFLRIEEANKRLEAFLAPHGLLPSMYDPPARDIAMRTINRRESFGPGSAERIDAEFYRPEYEEFGQRIISSGSYFRLGDYYDLSSGRVVAGEDELMPTFKQAVLTNAGINWSAVATEPGKKRGAIVVDGVILLAATAHEIEYVGKKVDYVRRVPSEFRVYNQAVADLIVLKPRDEKPAELFGSYVAAFLRHSSGRHQVQRCIRGLRGGHVYSSDLAQHVVVPMPPERWLQEFDELWRDAERAREEGKALMQRCLDGIEEWLENELGAG
ncbi:hypothetical protein JNW91_06750 [Micromonospora sp. STR1_7]|uniref:Restriction endonuclease subunit S n=1 Tax=Micromonospora parastrephiae TaxID=2806101 RepID=A0ABS1XQS1_9ACTN|nr:hypothetical protein [Micromonospora parastrephiae]MBM0231588.1 hypothetical protein [Micromonospora parastrephiae]